MDVELVIGFGEVTYRDPFGGARSAGSKTHAADSSHLVQTERRIVSNPQYQNVKTQEATGYISLPRIWLQCSTHGYQYIGILRLME